MSEQGNSKTDMEHCVDIYTCCTSHFHMNSHCTAQTSCAPGSRSINKLKTNCVPKTFTHPRVMFHPAPHSTLNTSTSSLSASPLMHSSTSPTPDLLSTHPFTHCKDPRQGGTSTEYQPLPHWDTVMIESLGEDTSCNQPLELRDESTQESQISDKRMDKLSQ